MIQKKSQVLKGRKNPLIIKKLEINLLMLLKDGQCSLSLPYVVHPDVFHL